MANTRVKLHHVGSCNLGKLGPDGVALKINFAPTAEGAKTGPQQSAVFGLSREVARGLAKALTAVLNEAAPKKPMKN